MMLAGMPSVCGAEREGFLNVPGGPVWFTVKGGGKGVPLLALHGGPGGSSCYLSALGALGTTRRVVLFDQLGGGRSGRPTDASLWTVRRFVEEVDTVRRRLGLGRIHLMGHSWGATLAAEYALAKGKVVQSLILASPLLRTADWMEDAEMLRKQLPADVQATLRRHEQAGTTDSAEYHKASEEYYKRFLSRTTLSLPECAGAPDSKVIYEQMWGPSEFHATGTLKSYDVTGRLGQLRMPVLLVVGEYDEARPDTAARYQKMMPRAELEVIPDAAHVTLVDQRRATLRVIEKFLDRMERR